MREPWATIFIHGWMLGNLAGLYFLQERFALVVAFGWLLAILLACVRRWLERRSSGDGRGLGHVVILAGFTHWLAAVVLLGDVLKARRRRNAAPD